MHASDYDMFVNEVIGQFRDFLSESHSYDTAIYKTAVASRTSSEFVENVVTRTLECD